MPGVTATRSDADRTAIGPGDAHAEPLDALLARLATDPARGLADDEAARRLAEDGPNELPKAAAESALLKFLSQFANPIVLTLLAAAVVALVDGASRRHDNALVRFGDASAILLIVALNAVLGFVQEYRAEAALAALERMQTPLARLRRGGVTRVVECSQVVAGDVLELAAGDAVPADARLLQTADLAAEESALTGESVPAQKDARAAVAQDATLGDRPTMVYVGTSIVRGKARAVVVATGARTELGRLSMLIQRPRDSKTPLEDKLEAFGAKVLWGCLGLAGLLFVRGLVQGDRSWHQLLLEAVSLAVAAIPEGLPAITTITLAVGMQRMARRGAIVRKLAAVETLGAATLICTDKTGTLTKNEMTVQRVYAGGQRFDVAGAGYEPAGEIRDEAGRVADVAVHAPLYRLLATAALCNSATLHFEGGAWQMRGDPTEGALLTLAAKAGISQEAVSSEHRVVEELPFDSDRRRMTVVTLDGAGNEVVHSKGSADVLLRLCAAHLTERGREPLDEASRHAVLEEADRMSNDALRVLALAQRDLGSRPIGRVSGADGAERREGVEDELTLLGLVGMIDPPRDGAQEAVALCADAGVRAVMITGDHKLTATAIARALGLWQPGDDALTGQELAAMTDRDLDERLDHVRVFARVTAEQKLRIVGAFKARGHVVAMTGDGVNDAPALREAHIGVAMGRGGTDVARAAADLVIADDNFATIVEAVREGRAIWQNIQKFVYFLLSSNAGLLVAVFTASFINALLPLTPLMILWINLVTNGLPALALGVDPPDSAQMRAPPRAPTAGLLGTRDWLGIAFVGAWMGAAAMACYWLPVAAGVPRAAEHGRAMAFSLLALSPLFHAFNCRSATASFLSLRPVFPLALVGAVGLSAAVHLLAVMVPVLRPVFRTFALSGAEWVQLLVLSASVVPAVEVMKMGQRWLTSTRGGASSAAEAPPSRR